VGIIRKGMWLYAVILVLAGHKLVAHEIHASISLAHMGMRWKCRAASCLEDVKRMEQQQNVGDANSAGCRSQRQGNAVRQ
jgi:hypothetical protein